MKTELEKKDILRLSNEESNKITRECLRAAMFKLMSKDEIDKISVTEITKLAGVSRVAFYRNYESKEDLVQDVCDELFNRLKSYVNSDLLTTDRTKWFTIFFTTIQNNSEYFTIYFKSNLHQLDNIIWDSLFPSDNLNEHYTNIAKAGAFSNIITEWFKAGMKESPEEMGALCDKILFYIGKDL